LRRDGLRELTDLEKDKDISEDAFYQAKEDLQKLTDQYIEKLDTLGEQKQAEIMEV
jgi:ribosome recycling factor